LAAATGFFASPDSAMMVSLQRARDALSNQAVIRQPKKSGFAGGGSVLTRRAGFYGPVPRPSVLGQ